MKIHDASTPSAELLSALVDGHLDAAEVAQALGFDRQSAVAFEQWGTYHLIGDVLRANSLHVTKADQGADVQFLKRLSQRLSLENVMPADPGAVECRTVASLQAAAVTQLDRAATQAANDGNARWKMLAGVACMGTVAALAWNLAGLNSTSDARLLAATGPGALQGQVVVTSPQGPVLRDARLEELLAAHKQMGGTSLPVPTGFLRNANFENQASAQR